MMIQEDIPYTKDEIRAMVNTIADLRKQVKELGWHSMDEKPVIPEGHEEIWVCALVEMRGEIKPIKTLYCPKLSSCTHGWVFNIDLLRRWCYLPE